MSLLSEAFADQEDRLARSRAEADTREAARLLHRLEIAHDRNPSGVAEALRHAPAALAAIGGDYAIFLGFRAALADPATREAVLTACLAAWT